MFVNGVKTFYSDALYTTQYAVTELSHLIEENRPDSIPGVFVRFEMELIVVKITATRHGVMQFITRLCGIVGGYLV
jgi:endoplasmic reticulum-Golgi intermediate compartment protein 2